MLLGIGFLILLTIALYTIRLLFPQAPSSLESHKESVHPTSEGSPS